MRDLGTTDTFMPYFRSDDQLQTVFNTSWTKGGHNVRFGTDIYYQALNHTQPEISGGDSLGARGGFRFQSGPTQLQGGADRQFLQRLRRVPARRPEPDRAPGTRRALYDAQLAVQPLRARPVAADLEDHPLAGHPVGILPGAAPRRPRSRALRRQHQHDDDRRRRLGADGSRRVGEQDHVRAAGSASTYRITERSVVRAGFGITNDPYSLARPMRTNHPAVLNLLLDAQRTRWQFVSRTADGIPAIPTVDLGNGIIPVPSPVTVFTLADKFERGYIRSFNGAFQRELGHGFVG